MNGVTFWFVHFKGQSNSRGGRCRVRLMSVGSLCGLSLLEQFIKRRKIASNNSLTYWFKGIFLDETFGTKNSFHTLIKLQNKEFTTTFSLKQFSAALQSIRFNKRFANPLV